MAARKKTTSGARKKSSRRTGAGKAEPRREPPREEPAEARSPSDRPFPIVGVGGSAGSLSALQELFRGIPADCRLGFVVVSHGDPNTPSLLPEILGRCTRMPVNPVAQVTAVEAGSIYIAPSGRYLSIRDGVLELAERIERGHAPLPIDVFFRSLARDRKGRSVGIVLSGTGTDATLGLAAIREESGFTLAQDPREAEFASMPASAVARGVVDLALPIREMPQQLLSFAEGAGRPRSPAPQLAEEEHRDGLEHVLSLVSSHAGQDFSPYKRGTLQRRVERRMGLHQIAHLGDYARYLEEDSNEIEVLWRDWLIGVSGFFRDPQAFQALGQELASLIAQKDEGGQLRAWVPGCASGEEVYSIAILVFEALEQQRKRLDVQIFATDLDSRAIETARLGRYPEGIASEVDPERIQRFFETDERQCRVKSDLRECIVFAPHNLLRDPPFTKMDLISCRNVLIYLGSEAQERLMPLLHYSLNPGGLLLLGASESITGPDDLFEPVARRWKLFRRRTSGAPAMFPLDWIGIPAMRVQGAAGSKTPEDAHFDLSELLGRQLVERYAPPAVIVDERGEIEVIHGRTGEFLEPAPGRAGLNVLEMAREGLRTPLASALRQLARDETATVDRTVQVRSNGGMVRARLVVRRVSVPQLSRPIMMVSFEPPKSEAGGERETKASKQSASAPSKRVAQLEDELRATRSDLQGTIEELQATNEELASANEEVQSVNEELQSMNEELLTSKEETQSLNEELQTVNAELSSKVQSLEQAQDDLLNLVNATEVAFVYLDEQLRVRRFTPKAQELFRLIESDVGRPLADLTASLDYPELTADAQQVLRTLIPTERDVRAGDGRWCAAQIRPYRTARNAIEGVILTFVDVTRVKEAATRAEDESRAFESIVDTVREPLLVMDGDLRVLRANASFYRTFRVEKRNTERVLLYELGDAEWDIPELRRLLERVLPENDRFEDYEVAHDFPRIGYRRMLLNARRLEGKGAPRRILLAIEDLTERPAAAPGVAGPTRSGS